MLNVFLFRPERGRGAVVPLIFHKCIALSSQKLRMSAIFNFQSLLLAVLLLICTCTYVRAQAPSLLDRNKTGPLGLFWKAARIGERLSPYVSFACFMMGISILIA
ncbi:hypothetical protein BX666DRAFT_537336 [Dichotomocladium elegans]|nr:hypothetical protein BX666DRAFT_537336 [Dichotomocladium elegans]